MRTIIFSFIAFIVCGLAYGQLVENDRIPNPHCGENIYKYYYLSKKDMVLTGLIFKDTVSVEEMVDSFYSHISNGHILSPYSVGDRGTYLLKKAVIIPSPLEKIPERELLKGMRGYWNLLGGIYLIDIEDSLGRSHKKLLDSIDNKYKSLVGWYDGLIWAWITPKYYMGYILSPHILLRSFKGGTSVHLETYYGPIDYFSTMGFYLHTDGNWTSDLRNSEYGLGHVLSANNLPTHALPSRDSQTSISVLIYDCGNGYYDTKLLLPQQPSKYEEDLFKALQFMVRKLQYHIFQPFYTTDFRLFTGRYYRVTYDKRGWWFEDYLSFYEQEFINK